MVGLGGVIGSERAGLPTAHVNIFLTGKLVRWRVAISSNRKMNGSSNCKSGKKPDDVPGAPQKFYANDGWSGWGDWLGTGNIANFLRARRYPECSAIRYANDGWSGIDDWLGTGKLPPGHSHRSFKKARAFVRSLNLKSGAEWKEYCRSGRKPADIPAKPDNGYANDGWAGMGEWLGTGAIAARFRQYSVL
jgi:hypothetical protein